MASKGGISGLAVSVAAVGGFLVYAGIRDVPLIEGLREIIGGKVPTGRAQKATAVWSGGAAVGDAAADMAGVLGSYALPGVQPHVRLAANEIGGAYGLKSIGGFRIGPPDHGNGCAIDAMTDLGGKINTPLNQRVAAYGYAHRERLGLTYIIADMKIASASKGWVWRDYKPITNQGDFRHVRHVHFSFKKIWTYKPRPTGGGPQAV